MIHLLQRHPKYVVLLAVLVVGSFLYLNAPYPTHDYTATVVGFPGDPSLPSRVERAERSYKKVLEKRQDLIKKHGPSPSQVVLYVVQILCSDGRLIRVQVPSEPGPMARIHRL